MQESSVMRAFVWMKELRIAGEERQPRRVKVEICCGFWRSKLGAIMRGAVVGAREEALDVEVEERVDVGLAVADGNLVVEIGVEGNVFVFE